MFRALAGLFLQLSLAVYVILFKCLATLHLIFGPGKMSFSIRPCSILIISKLNSYLSHKSSKAIWVCILYLLASALAPFQGRTFVEMFVTISQSGQT